MRARPAGPTEIADAPGVLLLTWSNVLSVRVFDFLVLEKCISKNQATLESFRNREILDYGTEDDTIIRTLYDEFLDVLQILDGKAAGRKSPVGVSKTLHLLLSSVFPTVGR